MAIKELTINGTLYQYQQQYLQADKLWECAFVDVYGNMAEVVSGNLVSYDESLGIAISELVALIKDNGLEADVDNEVVLWKNLDAETQRKIKVKARTLKMELWGEWDTPESRFVKWRNYMYADCGIWFSRGDFDRL